MKTVFIQGEFVACGDRPGAAPPAPELIAALARLGQAGYRVIVIAGSQLQEIEALQSVQNAIQQQLARLGGRLYAVMVCPHAPGERCRCHAPDRGLLDEAITRLRIDPSQACLAGNRAFAVLGSGMGARALVIGGDGGSAVEADPLPGVARCDGLHGLVEHLLGSETV